MCPWLAFMPIFLWSVFGNINFFKKQVLVSLLSGVLHLMFFAAVMESGVA